MSTKPKRGGAQSLPELPSLPNLPGLPDLGEIGEIELPDMDRIMAEADQPDMPNPFDRIEDSYGDSMEENSAMDDQLIDDEFAAIRAGRKQQQAAIDLANDSEFWFAVYFQTREQKERFLQAMKWIQHGDKYLDGQWVAKKQGVELPPRPAPYKVGRLDKKLTDLT